MDFQDRQQSKMVVRVRCKICGNRKLAFASDGLASIGCCGITWEASIVEHRIAEVRIVLDACETA